MQRHLNVVIKSNLAYLKGAPVITVNGEASTLLMTRNLMEFKMEFFFTKIFYEICLHWLANIFQCDYTILQEIINEQKPKTTFLISEATECTEVLFARV